MGSRGSGYEANQNAVKANELINRLTETNLTKAEHIQAYIEAISRRDKELVKMMDKHARFAFAESWTDEEGHPHQVSKDFLDLRKQLLNMTPAELQKVVVARMEGMIDSVTVEGGEITLNCKDGTSRTFDPAVSQWPI